MMCGTFVIRRQLLAALVVASTSVLLATVRECKAGIVSPAPISFDAKDLERELSASNAHCGSSAPRNSQQAPLRDDGQDPNQPDHLKPGIPLNQNSSSSSSSSAGGPAGSVAALGVLSGTIAIADDSLLGRLAEDHGLSLPDPPGTDLLRPPRNA